MEKNLESATQGVLTNYCIINGHNPLTGDTVHKTVYSQLQGFVTINQLSKEGYKDISYNFEIMDSLYRGVKNV